MGVTTSSTVAATYEPIETKTLTGSATSITFGSGGTLSQAYTDLFLIANLLYTPSGGRFDLQVGNGSIDTGSNYSVTELYGDGTNAGSQRNSNQTFIRTDFAIGSNTAWGMQFMINFQNYSNTTTYKTTLTRVSLAGSSGSPGTTASVGLWRSTSAINIIKFSTPSNNYATGSTFTLYGIKAA